MTLQNPPNPIYVTRDIYLAAVLRAANTELLDIQDRGDGRAYFTFRDGPDTQRLVLDFHNGAARLDPKKLFAEWKNLKSLAFATVEKQNQYGAKQNEFRNHRR